jgi:hypothetical protein
MNLPPYYSSSIDGLMLVAQGSSPDFNAAYREPGETTKTTGTNIVSLQCLYFHSIYEYLNVLTSLIFIAIEVPVGTNQNTGDAWFVVY